jgi:hypothetical protein
VSRSLLIVIALIGLLGILLQLWVSAHLAVRNGHSLLYGVLHALCYFTVLTNILVTIIAARLALGGRLAPGTLAAVAVYILVVGLIYSLLLRSSWAPAGLHRLADEILHDVTPALFVLWWLLCAPKNGLHWGQPVKWLGYPLAYFASSVLLGALTGRYLYPFADIDTHGLDTVLRNGALLLLLFCGLGSAAVAVAPPWPLPWRRRPRLVRMRPVWPPAPCRRALSGARNKRPSRRTTIRKFYGMAHQSHHGCRRRQCRRGGV